MSEIRYNLLKNEYVIIAPNRLTRPNLYSDNNASSKESICPFCKGNEELTPPEIYSIKDKNGWRVRVVPNLYKALEIEAQNISKEDGLYEKRDGFGAHEIIIDTPSHITCFEDLDEENVFDWLRVIRSRINDLKQDIRLTYFSIFKNQGQNSGATMPHIHTQLIAMPMIPKNELMLLKHYYDYYKKHGRSIFEDIANFEIDEDKRVILESEHFISFCPYGSRFAFEVMILPKVGISSIAFFEDEMLKELSNILKKSLQSLKAQIGNFDYNLYIQNPPFQKDYESEDFFDDIDKFYRCYISIVPRLYKIGGFEVQSKMYINPLAPESAAKFLRETLLP